MGSFVKVFDTHRRKAPWRRGVFTCLPMVDKRLNHYGYALDLLSIGTAEIFMRLNVIP